MSEKMLKFVKVGHENPPKRSTSERKEDFREIYKDFINDKAKEHRKTKKSMESFDKQSDKLDEHGVWSKYNKKGDAFASYEKRKLLEKGFPSKAKMAAGGIALRGLGRAFMKGGKV